MLIHHTCMSENFLRSIWNRSRSSPVNPDSHTAIMGMFTDAKLKTTFLCSSTWHITLQCVFHFVRDQPGQPSPSKTIEAVALFETLYGRETITSVSFSGSSLHSSIEVKIVDFRHILPRGRKRCPKLRDNSFPNVTASRSSLLPPKQNLVRVWMGVCGEGRRTNLVWRCNPRCASICCSTLCC